MPESVAIILAAGKGKRMKSTLPKALELVCGKPMFWFMLEKVKNLGIAKKIVIAGHGADKIRQFIKDEAASAVILNQEKQLGSGHAVLQAAGHLSKFNGLVLVLYCDTPLIGLDTLQNLFRLHKRSGADCTLLTVHQDDPTGYGRIKRGRNGSVEKIVEDKDATPAEKAIKEVNVGAYIFYSKKLFNALKYVPRNTRKNEYYLTDVVEILAKSGKVEALLSVRSQELLGVNTRAHLSQIQEAVQKSILDFWIEKQVRIRDPKTTIIDAGVVIGRDTVILPHTVIEGGSRIGRRCVIGPFARIRGDSSIGDDSTVGNFVEVVRSKIGRGTLVKHLSYIGDAELGRDVNIGAGTITANFDGVRKHKTIVGDGAQIGSGTVLIAPVRVGKKAVTGAGCVLPKNKTVPDGGVVVGVPGRVLEGLRKK